MLPKALRRNGTKDSKSRSSFAMNAPSSRCRLGMFWVLARLQEYGGSQKIMPACSPFMRRSTCARSVASPAMTRCVPPSPVPRVQISPGRVTGASATSGTASWSVRPVVGSPAAASSRASSSSSNPTKLKSNSARGWSFSELSTVPYPSAPSARSSRSRGRVGALCSQLASDANSLVGGLECLLAPPETAQPLAKVVERPGEVGAECVGALCSQLAVDLNGFVGGLERLLALPEVAHPDAEVVERRGEVGAKGVGALGGQWPVES